MTVDPGQDPGQDPDRYDPARDVAAGSLDPEQDPDRYYASTLPATVLTQGAVRTAAG